MKPSNFTVVLPEYYDSDAFTQFEVESKGLFMDVTVEVNEQRFRLTFYDIVRLKQDYESAAENNASYFLEANLVVIAKVTKELMLKAISDIYHDNGFNLMRPE